ncbi:DUF2207 domain-containing protein [Actinomadura flavalba]|uniref:DUF2207 domain-containing protein n=1 Tax=Actinomadura flavalba TaxID=1120938 RepID=UPI00146A3051|nr:DUF2207 domain-containing protein [Actinomadura flavalba]
MSKSRRRAAVVLAGCLAGTAAGGAAARADAGERMPTFDAVLTVRSDGVVHVRETVSYDFAGGDDRGITRSVPYRRGDRLYGVRAVRTSSSTGAPARARVRAFLHHVRITVGERGAGTVSGRQAYVIEYDLHGVLTPRERYDEFVWDVLGTGWTVPVGEAAVRVRAPAPVRAGCRAGRPPALTRCLRDRPGPRTVGFTQRGLAPGEGMTVKVRLPKGAVEVPPPRYAPPHWRAGAAGAAGAAVLVLGAALLTRRRAAPHPLAGRGLLASGLTVMLADVADDIARHGVWAVSVGDPLVLGFGLALTGAAVMISEREDRVAHGTPPP